MRTFQKTGLSGLALISLAIAAVGAAACSTETVYQHESGQAPADGTGTSTDPTAPADPSTQGDPTSKDTPAPPLVAGLAITDVAFFQAVKIPVLTAGKALGKSQRNAPVVAGRPALVRVYVKPGSGYTPSAVTAELRLVSGTTRLPVVTDTQTLTATSTDSDTFFLGFSRLMMSQ